MPILHVRNVPAVLYAALGRMAEAHGRSLSAEVLVLLQDAASKNDSRERMRKTLERLRINRESMPPLPPGVTSVDLVRGGRDRDDWE